MRALRADWDCEAGEQHSSPMPSTNVTWAERFRQEARRIAKNDMRGRKFITNLDVFYMTVIGDISQTISRETRVMGVIGSGVPKPTYSRKESSKFDKRS
jgi:hypothetical protein